MQFSFLMQEMKRGSDDVLRTICEKRIKRHELYAPITVSHYVYNITCIRSG